MSLERIEQWLRDQPRQPPVMQWQPALSGDMDMRIDRRGDWYHEGGRIERQPLINLFASILRREQDGEYYLVTPVEKWRIQVEDAPLFAVDMEISGTEAERKITFLLNTGQVVTLEGVHPLVVEQDEQSGEPSPYLQLDRGLAARLSRALFYRLVDVADERDGHLQVTSAGSTFDLGACV